MTPIQYLPKVALATLHGTIKTFSIWLIDDDRADLLAKGATLKQACELIEVWRRVIDPIGKFFLKAE